MMSDVAATNQLQLSFEDFQRFFKHSNNLIGFIEASGMIYPLNACWERVTGYDLSEIPARSWREFVCPDDHERTREAIKQAMSTGEVQFEHRLMDKDGGIRWISWDISYLESEEKAYMLGTDVTEKKEMDKNLLQMKEYYESIINDAQLAIDVVSLDGEVLSVNPEFERVYGWKKEEVIGQYLPIIPRSRRAEFNYIFHKIHTNEVVQGFKTQRVRKDGRLISVTLTVSPIKDKNGKIIAICGTSRDITREVELEKRLQLKRIKLEEANMRMTDILESITDGFCVVDKHFCISYVNKRLGDFVENHEGDMVGEKLCDYFPQSHLIKYENRYQQALQEKKTMRFQDYFTNVDKYVIISLYPTNDGLLIYVQDNTSQIKSIQALEESERRFQQITNNISEVFWVTTPDLKKWNYISPAFEKVFERPASVLLNNEIAWEDLIHPDDHEIIINNIERMKYEEIEMEYRLKESAEEEKWLRSKGFPVFRNGKVELIVGITEDITERKEHDSLIVKSEKLTTVGQLAAGVAHEIRNPLTAIKGFIQILSTNPQVQKGYIEIMLSELARIELIVNEFLLLAKPQRDIKFQPYPIDRILSEVVSLLRAEANLKGIEIIEEWPRSLPEIECEPNQLKQCFINLIKNGIEAMESSGKITVKGRISGSILLLEVIDQGPGMPKERLEKLGEPFYSTKEKGTGLGLMITMKMIQHHSGRLQFESELGVGTKATVALPVNS
ncbi:PAS domain S-box protein [Bacillus tianshenii]|nr:PAS domain S-box protein [Bacillus tianshenii]